ncbi:TPA: hypothetical protein N0F65_012384 [Lagenidium giganteum]|uniref:trimethyllysine dioxygenase n=1 Tax=Lagenidium giganteum TaxID=4803 RepID=A0AAV2YUB5_9STRA|nr:TPA: hypothetical protein N0F65_012384 [Lagenidium giganteum]
MRLARLPTSLLQLQRATVASGCARVSAARFASSTSAVPSRPLALQQVEELTREHAVQVTWNDGRSAKFHKKWLRDHCRCPTCLHPETKQRQVDTASIVVNPAMKALEIGKANAALEIKWDSDVRGNACRSSEFPAQWLREHAYSSDFHDPAPDAYRQDRLAGKHLWTRSVQIPAHSYSSAMADIKPAMQDLHKYGVVLVDNTPSSMDETEQFATKIGFVMRTIYGTMWTTNPQLEDQQYNDTASTNIELLHHTDGTYMRDPPGLQVFNCIEQAENGGESRYIDAFNVAETLRKEDPAAFEVLANTRLPYHHFDDDAHLATLEPIIKLDGQGRIVQFRHNDYDRAPLTHLTFEQVGEFYSAHSKLMEVMRRPEMELIIKLQVGQMIVVDNHRVLHARSAFDGSSRALIGCYIGRTEYESRLRVLGII